MGKLKLAKGEVVFNNSQQYQIVHVESFSHVIAERIQDGERFRLPINELKNEPSDSSSMNLDLITEEEWNEAKRRLEIIQPVLNNSNNKLSIIKEIEAKNKIHRATIYRWIERYSTTELLSSLVPIRRLGGKGKSRLKGDNENLLTSLIEQYYLSSQKLSVARFYVDVQLAFREAGYTVPHINTVRNRIDSLHPESKMRGRYGSKTSKETYSPIRGEYDHAKHPLSVVQIDHTLLDIILVDSKTREPIGRPWITIAIDVYSRMITGFYVSFDPPSSMNVGICLANSILSKEKDLLKYEIKGEWPCWGVMKVVHSDNAKEFKGNMIKRSCEEYGIELQWRPLGKTHWGGHIERLIGTILKEIHSLPGTTFSNVSERVNYDSERKATFTLTEIRHYLNTFIVEVYHNRKHSMLGMSPLMKYKEGVFGSKNVNGSGIPEKIVDEDKLRKDFMPFFERSIQRYGVKIDQITYYHDILRGWINSKDLVNKNEKRKFVFRRDPRDISVIYFLDPHTKAYHGIPCRDLSRPEISIWEYKDSIKKLKSEDVKEIDENKIFEAYQKLKDLKSLSNKTTKTVKRKRHTKEGRTDVHSEAKLSSHIIQDNIEDLDDIKPFDDIDYGSH